MRPWTPLLVAFAALASAQSSTSQYNAFNVPTGGYQVTAGQQITLTWSNPSSGTITIKLQQGSAVTPESGIVLAASVPASSESTTVTIPSDVNTFQYVFESVSDSDPTLFNFSENFGVLGATGTAVATTASQTGSITATGSAASSLSSAFSSVSASLSSANSVSSASASSSQSTAAVSSSAAASSASAAATSSAAATTTTAPGNSNGASSLKSQGGFLIALIGAIAVF